MPSASRPSVPHRSSPPLPPSLRDSGPRRRAARRLAAPVVTALRALLAPPAESVEEQERSVSRIMARVRAVGAA